MSLFSSIQMAGNSLRATQIGLQVVGQNISNANTPGYVREEVILTPAPTQRVGNLLLGTGVQVEGIVQRVDEFLNQRLRTATSDQAGAEAQEEAYLQLEGLIGELNDTDLSTSLNNFFASINEVLNQPESVPTRNLAVLKGQTLAGDIRRLAQRVGHLRTDVNKRVVAVADEINTLTSEIRDLNLRISTVEAGRTNNSDAVGLRDQRLAALDKLSELIDIQSIEQTSGGVAVFAGGDYLVFEGQQRDVEVEYSPDRGLSVAQIQIAASKATLVSNSGELGGLYIARDEILGGFLDQLDEFAETLAFEFNKVYSAGQGLTGFSQVASEFNVDETDAPLNEAGLPFTPVNGSFDVLVRNKETGLTETTTIRVDLDGLDSETTTEDLVAALTAIDGITASATLTGQVSITSDTAKIDFSFAEDTSGVLASLGINTFFSGNTALSFDVNDDVADDPSKFAASRGGIGQDVENAIDLAAFLDRSLESAGNVSLGVAYDRLVSQVTQGSTVSQSVAEGFRGFRETLNGQQLAISGVNLDEEAVNMITLQRTYQASARYIATLSELLDLLVSL